MQHLIIEGPTCSGKSTLIEAIQHASAERGLAVRSEHKGRPEELKRLWVLKDYVLKYEAPKWKRPDLLLADRWHYGEVTYAPVFRPDTNTDGFGLLGTAGWRFVELFLLSRGACTVILTDEIHILKARLRKRGDDHVTAERQLELVQALYKSATQAAPTVISEITSHQIMDMNRLASELLDDSAYAEKNIAHLKPWSGYIGPPQPRALLVGDRANIGKKYGELTRLPFLPIEGNSGDFLLSALPSRFWPSVGLVNGSTVKALRKLWTVLNEPPVVALGEEAEAALVKAKFTGDEYTRVDHPQAVRRFRFKDKMEYGQAIEEAAIMMRNR